MNAMITQIPQIGRQNTRSRTLNRANASGALTSGTTFQSLLQDHRAGKPDPKHTPPPDFRLLPDQICPGEIEKIYTSKPDAAAVYAGNSPAPESASGWQAYKDEQLLSNPGGDEYDYQAQARRIDPGNQGFLQTVAKDLTDSFGNITHFFQDLLFGSTRYYRDQQDQVRQRHQQGLLSSVLECVKDIGSGLSLGLWRPDGEKAPEGVVQRLGFSLDKVREAVWDDAVQGISGGVVNVSEDLLLAGWNLIEAVPDASIGHFESGRKLTTTLFDNGQVVIDYVTDIAPSGEAWLRVHSGKLDLPDNVELPVFYNLQTPEHFPEDARWRYVKNTPFRKTIETIGSLVGDVLTFQVLNNARLFSQENKEGN